MEFDRQHFEDIMADAVRIHVMGNYTSALARSNTAYEMAPVNSTWQGRAARDIAARYDRLNNPVEAEKWAQKAYSIHNGIVRSMEPEPDYSALRERAASGMYVGAIALRRELQGGSQAQTSKDVSPLTYLERAWKDVQSAKTAPKTAVEMSGHADAEVEDDNGEEAAGSPRSNIDQYEINLARRFSIAESVLRDPVRGARLGVRAVRLSFMSESPRLATSNPDLSSGGRRRAKVKAFAGGLAAISVAVLATPKEGRRRNIALKLADRSL